MFEIKKGLSFSDYGAIKAINASTLKSYLTSDAAHAKYIADNGLNSKAVKMGSAKHDILLSPEEFNDTYAIYQNPYDNFRTKAARESLAAFKEKNPDKVVLTTDEAAEAFATRNALLSAYPSLIKESEKELTILGEFMGKPSKARIDMLHKKQVIDIKTTNDIGVEACRKKIADYLYFGQKAFYRYHVANAFGVPEEELECVILFVESGTNFTRWWPIPEQDLKLGMRLMELAMIEHNMCELDNAWPMQPTPEDTSISDWARTKFENLLSI